MILNKSAVERGLAHGTIFKTETINLKDDRGKSQVGSTVYIDCDDTHAGQAQAMDLCAGVTCALDMRLVGSCSPHSNGVGPSTVQQLALAVQVFAAEMRGPSDRPQERPKGAFGQEYPQAWPSAASSSAVAGSPQVCPGLHPVVCVH